MIEKLQGKSSKIIKLIIAGAVLALVLFIVIAKFNPVKTQVILYGKAENKVNADGYLIRKEFTINSPADGVLTLNVQENERISKGQSVATVFSGDVDIATRNKLKSLNERIADLEGSAIDKDLVVGDPVAVDNAIKNRVQDIVLAVYNKDTSKVTQYKDDITTLLKGKKASGDEEVQVSATSTVDQLKREREELERSIGNKRYDLVAEQPGVFSSNIDGLENYFNTDYLEAITPTMLNSINVQPEPTKKPDKKEDEADTPLKKGSPCVKVSDNYQWYFAANVEERWGSDLIIGEEISIRFPDISDELIAASVAAVSKPENGVVAVVVACSEYVPDIYTLRQVNADIVRRTYDGFKLPKSAIRVNAEGQSGVFIVKEHIARFRAVNISYTGDDYVIVKEDNTLDNSLLLYDEVIISGDGIEEGKIIK